MIEYVFFFTLMFFLIFMCIFLLYFKLDLITSIKVSLCFSFPVLLIMIKIIIGYTEYKKNEYITKYLSKQTEQTYQ